jgi:hypothetical protein
MQESARERRCLCGPVSAVGRSSRCSASHFGEVILGKGRSHGSSSSIISLWCAAAPRPLTWLRSRRDSSVTPEPILLTLADTAHMLGRGKTLAYRLVSKGRSRAFACFTKVVRRADAPPRGLSKHEMRPGLPPRPLLRKQQVLGSNPSVGSSDHAQIRPGDGRGGLIPPWLTPAQSAPSRLGQHTMPGSWEQRILLA